MVRKLKHHEQKLLRKVDFLQWKSDNNLREVEVMRRYHIQVCFRALCFSPRVCGGHGGRVCCLMGGLKPSDTGTHSRTHRLHTCAHLHTCMPAKKTILVPTRTYTHSHALTHPHPHLHLHSHSLTHAYAHAHTPTNRNGKTM